jgi:hypothetical protein
MTTTHLTPKLTLGTITLTSQSSSSLTMLTSTTVLYNFTTENINNITGFVVSYGAYFYHLPSVISCRINGVPNTCTITDSNTLFFPLTTPLTSNIVTMQISNIVNYVKPANWSIRSVKTISPGTYSDVDVYSSNTAGVGAMGAAGLSSRVLFPNHYAQVSPVSFKVLVDSIFANVPVSALKLNITIPQGNCQLLGQIYTS